MRLVEEEWERTGVEAHPGKRFDGAKDTEGQGYHVGARSHVVGVAVSKRFGVLQGALHLLFGRRVIAVYWVERFVGKRGFCHSARALLRCICEATYRWVEAM